MEELLIFRREVPLSALSDDLVLIAHTERRTQ
jgi:hypothetical protein